MRAEFSYTCPLSLLGNDRKCISLFPKINSTIYTHRYVISEMFCPRLVLRFTHTKISSFKCPNMFFFQEWWLISYTEVAIVVQYYIALKWYMSVHLTSWMLRQRNIIYSLVVSQPKTTLSWICSLGFHGSYQFFSCSRYAHQVWVSLRHS